MSSLVASLCQLLCCEPSRLHVKLRNPATRNIAKQFARKNRLYTMHLKENHRVKFRRFFANSREKMNHPNFLTYSKGLSLKLPAVNALNGETYPLEVLQVTTPYYQQMKRLAEQLANLRLKQSDSDLDSDCGSAPYKQS